MKLADFETYTSLVAMFLDRAKTRGERPFLAAKRDGDWRSQSWREVAASWRKACAG